MTDTLFDKVHYSLDGLINDISLGRTDLLDTQRPFVWANAKVREGWWSMAYDEFLTACRSLIVPAVRASYEKLADGVA